MFCHQCGQKLPDVARFCIKCGAAVISDTQNQGRQEELSSDELHDFENEVSLLEVAARKGTVSDEHMKQALALCEKVENPEKHPVLQCYHYVSSTLQFFRKRWEAAYREDRDRGYAASNQGAIIVGDYKVFAGQGVTGLIQYCQLHSKYEIRIGLMYHRLNDYFKAQLLKEMFIALIADNEDPKTYKEAFNLIK